MIAITLTEQERGALLAMLDLAVKGGGLRVAETCVVLAKKIEAAQPQEPAAPAE